MIVIRIDGGLGNQMFQYAYGWYLARRHDTQLWLDIGSYASQPAHGYMLDQFQIDGRLLPRQLESKIPRQYLHARAAASASWGQRLGIGCLRRYKEKPFGFHPRHLSAPDQRYVVGYWQSEQFFPGMRSELLQQFRPVSRLSSETKRLAQRMLSSTSAAVHIRRGDYLSASAAGIYQHLKPEYYLRSLQDWARARSGVEVFVFSNDMSWCQRHLHLPWKTTWVGHHPDRSAHEDMWLMSQAACCVIANSTFSWWAAWLNERADKAIYAPAAWFQVGTLDDSHLIPDTWNRMQLVPAAEDDASFAVRRAA